MKFPFLPQEEARLTRFVSNDLDMLNRYSPKATAFRQSINGKVGNLTPAGLDRQTLWNAEELFVGGGTSSN